MKRTLLVLVVLTLPADAAPQLKRKKPAPGTEEARIEALRVKYDEIRKSGPDKLAEQIDLSRAEAKLRIILPELDNIARQSDGRPEHQWWVQKREREIRANPTLADLYDIALYDRKKAAPGK